jgi:lactobin A/cerein 7B family class IIb bacteriocin
MIMTADTVSEQTCGIRPLAEAELEAVNGGGAPLVAACAAAFAVGVLAGYWYTAGNIWNGVRNALVEAGLR